MRNDSTTETFAVAKLTINTKRWKGVPFFIKTGKALTKKETYIDIKFKRIPCLLNSCPRETNHLRIQIFPKAGIYMTVNNKIPGLKMEVVPIKLQFSEELTFGPNTRAAYENLLEQVMDGDQSVFVRGDEVEIAWKIIEKGMKKQSPLFKYSKRSTGPKELSNWCSKEKCIW